MELSFMSLTSPRASALTATLKLTALAAALLATGCGGTSSDSPVIAPPAVFTTIDGPGGAASGAATTLNGISNSNAVVGFVTANGANANFVRSASGAVTTFNVGDAAAGMATAVNTSGAIVGGANNNGFLLKSGVQSVVAPPSSANSIALGINDSGATVGQYTPTNAPPPVPGGVSAAPGFLNVNGTFTSIFPTTNGAIVNVQGINNNGQAIGFYSTDGTTQHGFLYTVATKQTTLLADPVTPRTVSGGLVLTQFLGLNDNGEAVGYYQTTNGSQFGFLYNLSKQTYTFLDAPGAVPVGGIQITQITGVSNSGQICGFYVDSTGKQRGFVATGATLK